MEIRYHRSRRGASRALAALFAALLATASGCTGGTGGNPPPSPAALQQQTEHLLNDPHVPDSVKQHLRDEQNAAQTAASGYTATLKNRKQ